MSVQQDFITFYKADGTSKAFELFNPEGLRRKTRTKQTRNSFAFSSRAEGDGLYDPVELTISGLVAGELHGDWMTQHRELLSWAEQAQKVAYKDWYFLVESFAGHRERDWRGTKRDNLTGDELTFNLALPFRISQQGLSLSSSLAVGANTVLLGNQGDVKTWPAITITGASITSVDVTVDTRTLDWTGSALSTDSLIIDCLNGLVSIGSRDMLSEVADDSLFPVIPQGGGSMTINVTGGAGTIVVAYEEMFL